MGGQTFKFGISHFKVGNVGNAGRARSAGENRAERAREARERSEAPPSRGSGPQAPRFFGHNNNENAIFLMSLMFYYM